MKRPPVVLSLLLCIIALVTAGNPNANAGELSASASVLPRAAGVGESVRLEVKVTGASRVAPPEVNVEGLEIRYIGPSQSAVLRSFNGSFQRETTVIFNYEVVAQRAGNFTIPAIQIDADGQRLQTKPVAFAADQGTGQGRGEKEELGRAEIVLPKKTAYVGEVIPIELRLMVDSRIRWGSNTKPEIQGEGFTFHEMPGPRHEQQQLDGRSYDVLVYQTAITPGKAGKLALGPSSIAYVAQVPRAQRNRQRSLFDLLDEGIFSDPMFAINQNFKARAEPVEIEVKPLPAAGRPADFSGAVGQFKMSAEGTPRQVKIGDPVTMKLAISGRGSFGRMEAPVLAEAAGWRAYPPSQEFKPDDEVGISGTKTFSMAVIPETKKTATPQFEFSYFDPATANYVTLRNEPSPLAVSGVAPMPATPPPAVTSSAVETAPAGEAKTPAQNDILGLRYDWGKTRDSFEPLYTRRGFWLMQLIPLGVLLAWMAARRLSQNPEARPNAARKRERAKLLARLRQAAPDSPTLFEDAVRLIQLEAAGVTHRDPASIDAADAVGARRVNQETARGIEDIFASRGELLYAGTARREGATRDLARERVLEIVEHYQKSHANP